MLGVNGSSDVRLICHYRETEGLSLGNGEGTYMYFGFLFLCRFNNIILYVLAQTFCFPLALTS